MLSSALPVFAITAPVPAPTPQPAVTPPSAAMIEARDEDEFYRRLALISLRQQWRDLNITPAVIAPIGTADIVSIVRQLEEKAQKNDAAANVALIRLQHWCAQAANRQPRPLSQIDELVAGLPNERIGRIKGVVAAEEIFMPRAAQSCASASFNYSAIETRLRRAAEAADPVSATELAQFVREPAQREALLQAAAAKGDATAAYRLATRRLAEVQRGERTEQVGSIRTLLKQAGQTEPKAKLDFANCVATGCDGHPAELSTAAVFALDAARDGEPQAYMGMLIFGWANQLKREDLIAWQLLGDRLNEAGCNGANYSNWAARFAQNIATLEKGQSPALITQAHDRAEDYWRDYGPRARKAQLCD